MALVACLIRDLNPASVTSVLKGDRIHRTIQNTLILTFKPLLEEGCLYGIKKFIVTQNDNKYKTTENKYRIIFLQRTRVCKLFHDAFPRRVYTFKSFEVIKSMENIYDARLFDVVGVVKEMGQPENHVSSNGKQSKLIELMLEDIEGNMPPCTLWEEYVDQFLKYYGKTCGAPKIMILQMEKPNMYRGEIKVVNIYYVTKVVMDSDVLEIKSFKERLGADSGLLDTIIISSISNGSSSTVSNELCTWQTVLKIIAQLFDGTERKEEVNILSEIEEALVDKKMMFKVNIRGEEFMGANGAYTVAKIITDPVIVNTYSGHLLDSQKSNCISNLETSNVNGEKTFFGQFEQDTTIEPPSSSSDEEKNLVGETPCSSSKEIGSIKRCLADSFSSTDASKKTTVFIKKEKE
ncbi:hypothetical protein C2S52_008392 [Perilla frutescens var. hirtella]|nr:hypothetical protein C2S52_008392 [Perilla frutescens var. hirtella]